MRKSIATGALAVAATGLLLSAGMAEAHIGPKGNSGGAVSIDAVPATAEVELAAGSQGVVCSNHAASVVRLTPLSTGPDNALTLELVRGACKTLADLEPGLYEASGFAGGVHGVPNEPCDTARNDNAYPDCPQVFEWAKLFTPEYESEVTFVDQPARFHIGEAPSAPTYGVPSNGNLNYPAVGDNNVPVVVFTFEASADRV